MAEHTLTVSLRMDPDHRDVLPGMLRALRDAFGSGRLTWSRYLQLRDGITRHVGLRCYGTQKGPDGTLTLRCYLDPSAEFLEAVTPRWEPTA